MKYITNKTGVTNDPLGQTHSLSGSEHCFHLKFVFLKWGWTDGSRDGRHVRLAVNVSRPRGSITCCSKSSLCSCLLDFALYLTLQTLRSSKRFRVDTNLILSGCIGNSNRPVMSKLLGRISTNLIIKFNFLSVVHIPSKHRSVRKLLLIHSADAQSQSVVITISSRVVCPYVLTYVFTFQIWKNKSSFKWDRDHYWHCGQAEWII